jgi:YYY domain-containing protein
MIIVLIWWLWMEVIGLAALPLAYRFFRRLPDRGYTFARPLGLLLTSYLLWIGGSFGLLRNSVGGALFSLLVVAGVSLFIYRRGRSPGEPGLLDWLRGKWRLVLAVELLFAAALAVWALQRAYSPDLTTSGGEKFMEIMYLNSIGRSDYFPPNDAWLSGYGISYYYFGYVMIAMLTRLSGFPAHLTFNVGLALLFALTCTGAFGLVYNLVRGHERVREPQGTRSRAVRFGFLGAILVAVVGNLEGFMEVLYSARLLPQSFWRWLDIQEINLPFNMATAPSLLPSRSGWWWWQASRVIHDLDPQGASMGIQPIDEFPGFSFLLGDMHPHVLALPFVLLALAVALNVLLQGVDSSEQPGEKAGWLAPIARVSFLAALCLGGLGFLNTWDFPIYLAILTGAYGLGRWPRYGRLNWPLVRDVALTGGATALLGFLLYLPFYIGFQSQAGGLLPTLYVGTRFRHYLVIFGPFLVAIGGLLAMLVIRLKRRAPGTRLLGRWTGWTAALLLVPVGLMLIVSLGLLLTGKGRDFLEGVRNVPAVYAIVGDASWPAVLSQLLLVKLRTWVMPLVVAGLSALGLVLLGKVGLSATEEEPGEPVRHPSIAFVLLCAVVGLLLTLFVEFFYLTDNFMVRMNTIFKFYFQAWVLMAVASAFAVYWLSSLTTNDTKATKENGRHLAGTRVGRVVRSVTVGGFWVLFALGMVYPLFGNYSRAGNFDHQPNLDGTAYLAAVQPDDYAAIAWLNEQVTGAPVILEKPGAGGTSYAYEGRVSALTGLPALLGWAGHEGQWRGNYEVQGAREPDIATIYNTLDIEQALTLLDKYGITYVYVGPLERSEYDPRGLDKFGRFMETVYQNDGVVIYKIGR